MPESRRAAADRLDQSQEHPRGADLQLTIVMENCFKPTEEEREILNSWSTQEVLDELTTHVSFMQFAGVGPSDIRWREALWEQLTVRGVPSEQMEAAYRQGEEEGLAIWRSM